MHRKAKPNTKVLENTIRQFPHCDARALHAPGECDYCDRHPEWQALRLAWGIAFTGYEPDEKELPCPAMHARPDTFQAWGGNRPRRDVTHCLIAEIETQRRYRCTRPAGHEGPCAAVPIGDQT